MPHAKKRMSLASQMIVGLCLGVVAGLAAPALHIDTAVWLRPLGQLFITLIRMVVVPLVFATIVAGAAGIHDLSKLGRVAVKTFVYYFATTAFAIAVGLCFANFMQPGVGLDLSTVGLQINAVTPPSLVQTLLGIVPVNPIEALSKGNMLQVIFFAVIFGFALSSLGEAGRPLLRMFELLGEVMIRMTGMIMCYAPVGVFGLMAYTVSQHGLQVLLPLGKFILTMFMACVVHVCLCYVPLIRLVVRMGVGRFFRGIIEPLLIAFTTCSSAAALPTNLQAVQRLGASRGVASFSIPLGNTINMDGTAIYMGIAAVFAAEVYGIDLTIQKQFVILLMGLLASIGTAGVPGAGLIMTSIVFTQVGIPLEAVALIAGIDRIVDMGRTSVNVLGDATGALVVSRLENELNPPADEPSALASDPA